MTCDHEFAALVAALLDRRFHGAVHDGLHACERRFPSDRFARGSTYVFVESGESEHADFDLARAVNPRNGCVRDSDPVVDQNSGEGSQCFSDVVLHGSVQVDVFDHVAGLIDDGANRSARSAGEVDGHPFAERESDDRNTGDRYADGADWYNRSTLGWLAAAQHQDDPVALMLGAESTSDLLGDSAWPTSGRCEFDAVGHGSADPCRRAERHQPVRCPKPVPRDGIVGRGDGCIKGLVGDCDHGQEGGAPEGRLICALEFQHLGLTFGHAAANRGPACRIPAEVSP